MKTALITGITGQDGAYLSRLLLDKGYEVHGIVRRSSSHNTGRLESFLGPQMGELKLHFGDLTSSSSVLSVLARVRPEEIYNLAAQSHVQVSFDTAEYTASVTALGALRLLEGMRILGLSDSRFYQASSSEMFGKVRAVPQSEDTPFHPRSPYGVAKLYAHWATINYRESYGFHASSGILFNHESPLRGETFVTRKVTLAAARISMGLQDCVFLGNMDARRDWGFAGEYVEGMYRMLQQAVPGDYVLATGETNTVRHMCEVAFARAGIDLEFRGEGVEEVGVDTASGRTVVAVDPSWYRPAEVDLLIGDASLARDVLGWSPAVSFETLVETMVDSDLRALRP